MRLVFIFLSIHFLISCASKKDTEDCDRFHNGTFRIRQESDMFIEISRNSTMQTEYDSVTDTLSTFDIVWNNSCEYTIKLRNRRKMTNTDSTAAGPPVEIRDALPVNVKIITSGKNYYVFEVRQEDIIYSDTMWQRQ